MVLVHPDSRSLSPALMGVSFNAGALLEYTDQNISIMPLRGDPAGGDVDLHHEVKQNDDRKSVQAGRKVSGLSIDGIISRVANYRPSFASEIQDTGPDDLILRPDKLNFKAEKVQS